MSTGSPDSRKSKKNKSPKKVHLLGEEKVAGSTANASVDHVGDPSHENPINVPRQDATLTKISCDHGNMVQGTESTQNLQDPEENSPIQKTPPPLNNPKISKKQPPPNTSGPPSHQQTLPKIASVEELPETDRASESQEAHGLIVKVPAPSDLEISSHASPTVALSPKENKLEGPTPQAIQPLESTDEGSANGVVRDEAPSDDEQKNDTSFHSAQEEPQERIEASLDNGVASKKSTSPGTGPSHLLTDNKQPKPQEKDSSVESPPLLDRVAVAVLPTHVEEEIPRARKPEEASSVMDPPTMQPTTLVERPKVPTPATSQAPTSENKSRANQTESLHPFARAKAQQKKEKGAKKKLKKAKAKAEKAGLVSPASPASPDSSNLGGVSQGNQNGTILRVAPSASSQESDGETVTGTADAHVTMGSIEYSQEVSDGQGKGKGKAPSPCDVLRADAQSSGFQLGSPPNENPDGATTLGVSSPKEVSGHAPEANDTALAAVSSHDSSSQANVGQEQAKKKLSTLARLRLFGLGSGNGSIATGDAIGKEAANGSGGM